MGGWGGVVAQGLLGAAEGVGAAGAQSMLEKEKEDALARRDAALATLAQQTHAANAQASSDIETAAIPGRAAATNDALNANAPDARSRSVAEFNAQTPGVVDRARQEEANKEKIVPDGSRLIGAD